MDAECDEVAADRVVNCRFVVERIFVAYLKVQVKLKERNKIESMAIMRNILLYHQLYIIHTWRVGLVHFATLCY